MAQKEEFQFLSYDNKTNIHAIRWAPDSGEYKAILQITHGMLEYINRYHGFAEYLTEHGFLVVGHDNLGHGESVRTQADWGYIAHKNGSDCMVEDMHQLRTMIQRDSPDIPYFMLGHSMGSYLLRKYITKYNQGLSGVLIVGTGHVENYTIKLAMVLTKFLATVRGWRHRSKFLENIVFSGVYKKFDMNGTAPEHSWLTRDVEIVNCYYKEPRCTFRFTLNGFYSFFETVLYDNQQRNIEKIPKTLPIIILSGDNDPVGDLGVGVKKVYTRLQSFGMTDITCKLYKDYRHEIINEIGKDIVYQDILLWCEERI